MATMTPKAYLRQVHVSDQGRIVVEGLEPRATVDVWVVQVPDQPQRTQAVPISKYRGMPFRMDNPFDPVLPPDDWDALR